MSRKTLIFAVVFGSLVFCSFFGTVGEVPRRSYSYWIPQNCPRDALFGSRCAVAAGYTLDLERGIHTPLAVAPSSGIDGGRRSFLEGFQRPRPPVVEGAWLEGRRRLGREDPLDVGPRNLLVLLTMAAVLVVGMEKILSLVCDRRRLQDAERYEQLKKENPRRRIEASNEKGNPRRRIEASNEKGNPRRRIEASSEKRNPRRRIEASKENPRRRVEASNKKNPRRRIEASKENPRRRVEASNEKRNPRRRIEASKENPRRRIEASKENPRRRVEASNKKENPRRRTEDSKKDYVVTKLTGGTDPQRLIPAEDVRQWLVKGVKCTQCLQASVVSEEKLTAWETNSGPMYCLPCFVQGPRGEPTEPLTFLVDTGCSYSVIYYKDVEKLGLLAEVDRDEFFQFNAMGGRKGRSYGTLKVPLKTASGVTIARQLGVLKLKGRGGVLGLDFLVSKNCSLILDPRAPKIEIRETCGFISRTRPLYFTLMAKLNGEEYPCLMDTGSTYCFVPKDLGFPTERIWRWLCLEAATKWPLVVCKRVPGLRVEFAGCVHFVDALVANEPFPVLGTEVLQGKRIDFVHGVPYLTCLRE